MTDIVAQLNKFFAVIKTDPPWHLFVTLAIQLIGLIVGTLLWWPLIVYSWHYWTKQ